MSNILGVGVDLCEITRMEPLLQNERFLARCFTPDERAYLLTRGQAAPSSLAGLWAAKEAALKALGTGLALPLTDIEITHAPTGQPLYRLHHQAARLTQATRLHLSISHDANLAIAFCVWSDAPGDAVPLDPLPGGSFDPPGPPIRGK